MVKVPPFNPTPSDILPNKYEKRSVDDLKCHCHESVITGRCMCAPENSNGEKILPGRGNSLPMITNSFCSVTEVYWKVESSINEILEGKS